MVRVGGVCVCVCWEKVAPRHSGEVTLLHTSPSQSSPSLRGSLDRPIV